MLTPKKRIVEEEARGYGLYVWQATNGSFVRNASGDWLCVGPVAEGNQKAILNLAAAAANCGFPSGKAVWLNGFRKISESEWEDQMERLQEGKIPDAADLYHQNVNGD